MLKRNFRWSWSRRGASLWFFGLGALLGCLCLTSLPAVHAQVASPEVIQRSISAYDEGRFDEAVGALETLVAAEQANGHLLYNLGNAYYRDGQAGRAMASYLGARFYLPRNPDLRANLKFASEKLPDRLEISLDGWHSSVAFWLSSTTAREVWWTAAWILALAFVWLALCMLWPMLRQQMLVGWVLLSIGLALSGAGLVSQLGQQHWGAITAASAKVWSGPGEHNTVLFQLNEGAPFVVRQTQGGWYLIELSDGKKGWVASDPGVALCYTI